jgi:hypothetical protein
MYRQKIFSREEMPAFLLTKVCNHLPKQEVVEDKIDYEGLRKSTEYMTVFTLKCHKRNLTYSGKLPPMQKQSLKYWKGAFQICRSKRFAL